MCFSDLFYASVSFPILSSCFVNVRLVFIFLTLTLTARNRLNVCEGVRGLEDGQGHRSNFLSQMAERESFFILYNPFPTLSSVLLTVQLFQIVHLHFSLHQLLRVRRRKEWFPSLGNSCPLFHSIHHFP